MIDTNIWVSYNNRYLKFIYHSPITTKYSYLYYQIMVELSNNQISHLVRFDWRSFWVWVGCTDLSRPPQKILIPFWQHVIKLSPAMQVMPGEKAPWDLGINSMTPIHCEHQMAPGKLLFILFIYYFYIVTWQRFFRVQFNYHFKSPRLPYCLINRQMWPNSCQFVVTIFCWIFSSCLLSFFGHIILM